MTPKAYISHQIQGRTRIHVPAKKQDHAFFEHCRHALKQLEGIDEVEANPLTGSLLVLATAAVADIIEHARSSGLFDVAERGVAESTVLHRVAHRVRHAEDRIFALSSGHLDIDSMILIGFGGLSLIQLLRKKISPPALTMLWYAYGLAHRRELFGHPKHT